MKQFECERAIGPSRSLPPADHLSGRIRAFIICSKIIFVVRYNNMEMCLFHPFSSSKRSLFLSILSHFFRLCILRSILFFCVAVVRRSFECEILRNENTNVLRTLFRYFPLLHFILIMFYIFLVRVHVDSMHVAAAAAART